MIPRVIAEIGTSHGGDLGRARELIHAARDAGADTAKFQLVRASEILHPLTGSVSLPGGSVALYDRFAALEKPDSFFVELKKACADAGVRFLCTPFGIESARILRRIGVDEIKIASPELNHIPLLAEVASYQMPLLLSTGVSRLSDISEALETLHAYGRSPVLLHCITAYPAPETEYNIRVIPALRAITGAAVGISDHSVDPTLVPVLATLLGATTIEKHITLDKDGGGLDDQIALSPDEFSAMVTSIRIAADQVTSTHWRSAPLVDQLIAEYGEERINVILGDGVKQLAPSEERNYGRSNRSIHALVDISVGTRLDDGNIAVLRSEHNLAPGLHPRHWSDVLGATAHRPIPAGRGVGWADLLD